MTGAYIIAWNRYGEMIEKCKKAMKIGNLPSLAIEVEYYKRLQLGDSEQEAYEYVLYRKTNILWEYRRDYHGAVI